MKLDVPEISWHSQAPLYSIDINSNVRIIRNRFYHLTASAGSDGMIGIWLLNIDLEKPVIIFLCYLEKHAGTVNVVRFNSTGDLLASGGDDSNLIIWKNEKMVIFNDNSTKFNEENKENWVPHFILRGHIDSIYDLAWFSDNSKLVTASTDNTTILWDIKDGKYLYIFRDSKHFIQGVAVEQTQNLIVSQCADGSNKIYCSKTFKSRGKRKTLYHNKKLNIQPAFSDDMHPSFFRRCSFSPDGLFYILVGGYLSDNVNEKCSYLYSSQSPKTVLCSIPTQEQSSIAARFSSSYYKLVEGCLETNPCFLSLNYRMVFAILTVESLLIFDTQHIHPIGLIKYSHFSKQTDLSWFPGNDGIIFSSTDGYCSIVTFLKNELGEKIDKNVTVVDSKPVVMLPKIDVIESSRSGQSSFIDSKRICIIDEQPEDITPNKPIGVSAMLGFIDKKPKRVPFFTIQKK